MLLLYYTENEFSNFHIFVSFVETNEPCISITLKDCFLLNFHKKINSKIFFFLLLCYRNCKTYCLKKKSIFLI